MTPELTWLVITLYTLLALAPAVITGMKGQWALLVAGILTIGLVWVIAAFRLARPSSFWARTFYDEGKMARAWERYG